MEPVTIVINGERWTLVRRLGSGGFGMVYLATSGGRIGAIKLVPKDPGAESEILVPDDLRNAANVMPVWGIGEFESYWAILMPLAEKSLRNRLVEVGGRLAEVEALPILADIARTLRDLRDIGVVHRDLKPDNVLLYDGRWCLGDFGIVRYAKAAERIDTRKYSTTQPYAAPEQWRDETVTWATDVYAFGILAHELLAGAVPFRGPGFRYQHLHEDPPGLVGISPSLASMIQACLFKSPETRPAPEHVLDVLLGSRKAKALDGDGLAKLEEANNRATSELAKRQRQASEERSQEEDRGRLAATARRRFVEITSQLRDQLMAAAPAARFASDVATSSTRMPLKAVPPVGATGWEVTLGVAKMGVSRCYEPKPALLYYGKNHAPVTVIAEAGIAVAVVKGLSRGAHPTTFKYMKYNARRAHILWFCNIEDANTYDWYELGFSHDRGHSPNEQTSCQLRFLFGDGRDVAYIIDNNSYFNPVEPDDALSALHLRCYHAWPLNSLRLGSISEFIDRWAGWLASAAEVQF